MKKLLLLGAVLLVLSAGYFLQSELTGTKSELAAAQAQVRLVEQQRVPRVELDRAKAAATTAQERTAAQAQELQEVRAQLAATQVRAEAAERRLSQPADPKSPPPPLSLTLVKGTYTVMDDTILYSADAELKLGNGITITSPSGLMMTDNGREIVAGNLVVETPSPAVQTAPTSSAPTDAKPDRPAEGAATPKP